MNLQSLWQGSDYSWWIHKGRGETIRMNGKRVKVVRTFSQRLPGNKKDTGYAVVILCEDDGEMKRNEDGTMKERNVKARDIAMRWEEYEDERDRHKAEQDERERERKERYARQEEEWRKRDEERRLRREEEERRLETERVERERLERESRERITNYLSKLGLTNGTIERVDNQFVILNRTALEQLIQQQGRGF